MVFIYCLLEDITGLQPNLTEDILWYRSDLCGIISNDKCFHWREREREKRVKKHIKSCNIAYKFHVGKSGVFFPHLFILLPTSPSCLKSQMKLGALIHVKLFIFNSGSHTEYLFVHCTHTKKNIPLQLNMKLSNLIGVLYFDYHNFHLISLVI